MSDHPQFPPFVPPSTPQTPGMQPPPIEASFDNAAAASWEPSGQNQPPVQPPMQPPMQPPIYPPMQPPVYPPMQPPPYAPIYPAGYAMPARPPVPAHGLAIASLVLGILSLVLLCVFYISIILSVLGLIFGGVAMVKQRRVGAPAGMATAGLVCSGIGFLIVCAIIAYMILSFTLVLSDPSYPSF